MKEFLSRLRIPTILGIAIIFLGIIPGVYLVLQQQTLVSFASPNATPNNIEKTNITDSSVTISFTTNVNSPAFIKYGQGEKLENSATDIRDSSAPGERTVHYITLKNLSPATEYRFVIQTGKNTSGIDTFTTALKESLQNGYTPVTGIVLKQDNIPSSDGIVYLSIPDSTKQSALIKSGNFIIPLSYLRKSDLSDVYIPGESDTATLQVVPPPPGRTISIPYAIKLSDNQVPPIILGQDSKITNEKDISYDVNGDRSVNIFDYSQILSNLGKTVTESTSDLDKNRVIDNKDLDLIFKRLQSGGK